MDVNSNKASLKFSAKFNDMSTGLFHLVMYQTLCMTNAFINAIVIITVYLLHFALRCSLVILPVYLLISSLRCSMLGLGTNMSITTGVHEHIVHISNVIFCCSGIIIPGIYLITCPTFCRLVLVARYLPHHLSHLLQVGACSPGIYLITCPTFCRLVLVVRYLPHHLSHLLQVAACSPGIYLITCSTFCRLVLVARFLPHHLPHLLQVGACSPGIYLITCPTFCRLVLVAPVSTSSPAPPSAGWCL